MTMKKKGGYKPKPEGKRKPDKPPPPPPPKKKED